MTPKTVTLSILALGAAEQIEAPHTSGTASNIACELNFSTPSIKFSVYQSSQEVVQFNRYCSTNVKNNGGDI